MTTGPALFALRAATGEAHSALEVEADIEARLRDPATRPATVARLLAYHRSVEQALAPWTDAMRREGFETVPRSLDIATGLTRLGGAATTSVEARIDTLGQAFGWAYVAEGSMLGGRVMLRRMATDGIAADGLDFLDPYGEATGSRWRGFISAMEGALTEDRVQHDDIVSGGVAGFAHAQATLCAEPAHG